MEKIRAEIDEIDEKIKFLLDQRFELSKEVGKYKQKNHIEVSDSTREKVVIKKIIENVGNAASIKKVYELIFILSKELQ